VQAARLYMYIVSDIMQKGLGTVSKEKDRDHSFLFIAAHIHHKKKTYIFPRSFAFY